MFVSSKGASTSSKMQKGAGLSRYKENRRAVEVSVFSPPESWLMDKGRFPFGRAIISISDSRGKSGLLNTKSQESSSLNKERKTVIKCSRTWVKDSINLSRAVSSISLMVSNKDVLASKRSLRSF